MSKVPVFARGGGEKRKRGEIPDHIMTQSQVWLKLRDAFYKVYPIGHIVRIENQIGRGMPDVYYRISKDLSAFIEIKTGYQKPTELQKAWHELERASGGLVILLTVRPTCVIIDRGKSPQDFGICTWTDIVARL